MKILVLCVEQFKIADKGTNSWIIFVVLFKHKGRVTCVFDISRADYKGKKQLKENVKTNVHFWT